MCNCGIYKDNSGEKILGTPVRVAQYLARIMQKYPTKKTWLYFNDISSEKVELLRQQLPSDSDNFHIIMNCGDGNELLKKLATSIHKNVNYLLVYDPYTASIDWDALLPFLRNWGEVIINHMVSDSIRGISQAKNDSTVAKYEKTYLASINQLLALKNDRNAFEKRLKKIIEALQEPARKQYYIASFPFFNSKNALVYNLIHCSSNLRGFRLFKRTAWKTFGGKSSIKDTHGTENQLIMDFDGMGKQCTKADEYCYYIKDIVEYLHNRFIGQKNVTLEKIWQVLDGHPVFPSDGYRNEIKKELKSRFNDVISKQSISFSDRR